MNNGTTTILCSASVYLMLLQHSFLLRLSRPNAIIFHLWWTWATFSRNFILFFFSHYFVALFRILCFSHIQVRSDSTMNEVETKKTFFFWSGFLMKSYEYATDMQLKNISTCFSLIFHVRFSPIRIAIHCIDPNNTRGFILHKMKYFLVETLRDTLFSFTVWQ